VGKAVTAEFKSQEYGYSFIAHEKEGVEVARKALQRLCFTNKEVKLVLAAVRWHMPNICSPKAARRFLVNTGDEETARFVLDVMRADGYGRRETDGGRALVVRALAEQNAFTVRDLKVSGEDVMRILGCPQGPCVGAVLDFLLALAVCHPTVNERETLVSILEKILEKGMVPQ
jgi:tRNA nucleotidyltransferase (CCA-adding enzyme)